MNACSDSGVLTQDTTFTADQNRLESPQSCAWSMGVMLKEGEAAPAFDLPDPDMEMVSLSSFTGRSPAYQRALDHSQSSALATSPRRTGLA